jgi:hypothetical protein
MLVALGIPLLQLQLARYLIKVLERQALMDEFVQSGSARGQS